MKKGIMSILCSALLISTLNSTVVKAEAINDNIVTVIEQSQKTNKIWKVRLNQNVDKDSVNENNIFVTDEFGFKLDDIRVRVLDNKILEIENEEGYKEGKSYTLHLTSTIKSVNGNNLNKYYEYRFNVKDYSYEGFKISDIKVEDNKNIEVYFTQPLGEEAEISRLYQITDNTGESIVGSYKSMVVKKIENKNAIKIYLKEDELKADRLYTVSIYPDLQSKYGNRLNDGEIDVITFEGTDKAYETLKATDINVIDDNKIEVIFNNYVGNNSSLDIKNYSIMQENGQDYAIKNIYKSNSNDKIIIETAKYLDRHMSYRLQVKGVKDIFEGSTINYNELQFVANNINKKDLQFSMNLLDNKTLEIVSNYELEEKEAINIFNYAVYESGKELDKFRAEKIYLDQTNKCKVTLLLNRELGKNKNYVLELDNRVKSIYGHGNSKTVKKEFINDKVAPTIINVEKAKILGDNKIKVTFNRDIKNEETINLNTKNYKLEAFKGSNTVISIGSLEVRYLDSKNIVLTFDALDSLENYNLKVNKVLDVFNKVNDFSGKNILVEK